MGTRSLIGKLNPDGSVDYIYCHWDGYVSNNGVLLFAYYDTAEKVADLIALGGISSLRGEIGEKHDFDDSKISRQNDWCTAYHRDRDEELDVIHAETEDEFWKASIGTEYWYLFKDGQWWVQECYDDWNEDGDDGTQKLVRDVIGNYPVKITRVTQFRCGADIDVPEGSMFEWSVTPPNFSGYDRKAPKLREFLALIAQADDAPKFVRSDVAPGDWESARNWFLVGDAAAKAVLAKLA